MKLEFHQLDRRYEHLRVRNPERQRRVLASLAASGQQTPIVVVAKSEKPDRYQVIRVTNAPPRWSNWAAIRSKLLSGK
jgi:hypothetical protein